MMNLDTPEQGPKFAYAFQAAVKATRQAYQELLDRVGQEETRQAFESWAVNGSEVR
jgi:hypothetical protein